MPVTLSKEAFSFSVSHELGSRFAAATGDKNSLHVDPSFARRSPYRQCLVHGMLPVAFLGFLDVFQNQDAFLKEITAYFIKPVFYDDRIVLEVKALNSGHADEDVFEFQIRNVKNTFVVTHGSLTVGRKPALKIEPGAKQKKDRTPCWVHEDLRENVHGLKDIEKGQTGEFSFGFSESSLKDFYGALCCVRTDNGSQKQIKSVRNLSELACVCLYSTFVGMCIPGRFATFVGFSAKFNQALIFDTTYHFKGEVVFKSLSTERINEKVTIQNKGETVAQGEIKAKVNRKPLQMPTIDELKKEAKNFGLEGKVALVTGASRGIGETIAKLLSVYGAKVIINYRTGEKEAEAIVKEIQESGSSALAVKADVSNPDDVRNMVQTAVQEFGSIDILVNNAVRNAIPIKFEDLSWEEIQKDMDVTLKGSFLCAKEVIPIMKKSGFGRIINLSTVFVDVPPPEQIKYVIAKSALLGLTRSLAVEMAGHKITVNMVEPSMTETDLSAHVPQMILNELAESSPMGRIATTTDIAKAVIFLASTLSEYTTGQKIMVTGGTAPFV